MGAGASLDGVIEVTDAETLRAILGAPSERAAGKDRDVLHPMHVRWIAASPLVLVATADADGRCDVSPKGDPAGFVKVLDERTLVLPERPGNRRADGFHNILTNPHVGLIFLIPGRTETLRVNGRARLVSDAPWFDALVVEGHRPKLALQIDIEQLFFHCSKAFLRSHAWESETWAPDAVPPRPEIVLATEPTEMTLDELRAYYGPSYLEGLYRDR